MNEPYFIFKGTDSRDMGILIASMPDIKKPQKRISSIEVPGRNGVLHQDEGAYANYTLDIGCGIKNGFDTNSLCHWLNGYGELILSTEPDKVYRAVIWGGITLTDVIWIYSSFLIQFDVYPLKYSVNAADDMFTVTGETAVYNRGTYYSEPVITVYGSGSGTVTINGRAYTLSGISQYVTLNSEIQEVYKDNANRNNTFGGAEFPRFEEGENVIGFSGGIERLEVQPNWRYL